jgi:hypothetical protein
MFESRGPSSETDGIGQARERRGEGLAWAKEAEDEPAAWKKP